MSYNMGAGGGGGWCMVLGKLPVPGRPTYSDYSIARPTALSALTAGAGGDGLDIVFVVYHFSLLSPSLGYTARYKLKYFFKYCLKGPLSPKQSNNLQYGFSLIYYRFYHQYVLQYAFLQHIIRDVDIVSLHNVTGLVSLQYGFCPVCWFCP